MQRSNFKGYKLDFKKSALKDLKKLDITVSKKIVEKFEDLIAGKGNTDFKKMETNAIINKYGGKKGLRDKALLESAIHQPLATFNNTILHQTIHDMAAAYFFHIIKNHPFLYGNKRTGLVTAFSFLRYNELHLHINEELAFQLAIKTALGEYSKQYISQVFKENTIVLQQ